MRKRFFVLVLLLLFVLPFAQAQEPVVYGVFFYSPTCPHCHVVMEQHWPGIAARFGEQLKVVFVDVTTAAGRELMQTAIWSLDLRSSGVPQLIIGDEVMVGEVEIPQRAPQVIEAGLAAGGIAYPNIPHVEDWFNNAGIASPTLASINPLANLSTDPANVLAIILLLGMALSFVLVLWAGWQTIFQSQYRLLSCMNHEMGWWAVILAIFMGIAVALSLLFGSSTTLVFVLALVLAGLFLLNLLLVSRKSKLEELPNTLIPILLLVGLMASAYLSYVEMTLTEPVCGAWGDCMAVQQSNYAQIGGMPIAMLGLLVYGLMFVLYLGRKFIGATADLLLFVLTTVGLAFSVYLTFLEPFVIGATCAWCLTSAIVMLNLFWLIVPRSLATMALPKERKQYA